MGFFRGIKLDVHAKALSTSFAKLREEQFSCILHNVEHALQLRVAADRRVLSGDADSTLKAFQYWTLMIETRLYRYVQEGELDKFSGMAMKHGWTGEREIVSRRIADINSHRDNPAEQIVHVAIPIADYLFMERRDPRVWAIMGQTLVPFHLQTQTVIANEFGDQQRVHELQLQLEYACNTHRGRD